MDEVTMVARPSTPAPRPLSAHRREILGRAGGVVSSVLTSERTGLLVATWVDMVCSFLVGRGCVTAGDDQTVPGPLSRRTGTTGQGLSRARARGKGMPRVRQT